MINYQITYLTQDMIKQELKSYQMIIEERVMIEADYFKKIKDRFLNSIEKEKDEVRKKELKDKYLKYHRRNFGKVRSVLDFYDMRIHAICNHLDRLSVEDRNYIIDIMIYPISIKELINLYNMKDANHCYRKLDKLLVFMTREVKDNAGR